MRRIKSFLFFLVLVCFVSSVGLQAQTSTTTSTQFDTTDFPQWAKDLRRGEIVAFGSFPFAYLIANFAYDSYRLATNGWDMRYAPMPFNAPGTVEKNQSEMFATIWLAAGTAVAIALVDYAIMRYNRSREEREIRNLPEGTPIISRRPLWGDEADTAGSGD